jgi:hypothetical protein
MPEDRDQLFERALARHLRAESAGESLCLDPETLAAYHQRMLSPAELPSAKSHIVSCARCQQVLAQLEATQEVNEIEEVADRATAGAARALPPEPLRQPLESPAGKPRKAVVALPQKKTFTLRWAAAAGAVAAALLISLAVRDSRLLQRPGSESATQVAENRRQLPSGPPREEAKESSRPKNQATDMPKDLEKQRPAAGYAGDQNETTRSTRGEPAPGPPLLDERNDSAVEGKLEREKKSSPAYEYSARNGIATGGRGPSAAAAQAQANSALQGGAAPVFEAAPAPGDLDKAQRQPPAAKSDALVAAAPAPAPLAPPSSRDQKQPAGEAGDGSLKAKTAEVSSATTTGREAFNAAAFSRAVSKISLDIRITAPGGNRIWSVGPAGQIFHSTDAGRTWLLQISGVAANLIGGSAPSDQVCWIAGAAGTLLRTTDSGLHWLEIRTPIAGDLGGVHASDAKHASIWDQTNHLSYETSDGGRTWKQSLNE